MNAAHIHLVLNHFPIFGLLFSFVLMLAGVVRRNSDVARAGVVLLAVTTIIAIAVYLSGEPAEEIVEHLPGMSEEFIEPHEEAGLLSLFGLELLGIAAVFGLVVFRRPRPMPGWFLPSLLLLTLIVGLWVGWTSHLGGQIRHTETRGDFDAAALTEDEER